MNTVRKLEIVNEKLPAGIRKRGDSFLVDVSYKGVRRTGTFETLAAAIEGQGSIKAELMREANGTATHDDGKVLAISWTLQQAFEKTCDTYWIPEKAKSWEHLQRNAEMVLEHFGKNTRLDSITTEHIDAFVKALRKAGQSNATINRKQAALSKMLTVASDRDGCTKRPKIERHKEMEGRLRWLSKREEEAMLSLFTQWSKDDHAEVFCVLVDTGLRPSEIWQVAAKDVHLDEGFLSVWRSKNGKTRSVPMTSRVKEILGRRMELHLTGPLFPFSNDWFSYVWDKAKEHLKLDADGEFIPYILRHTCASRLVQRGVAIQVVKEWLGHENIKTTMRYAKLAPNNLLAAVKVLEEL